MGIFKHKEDEKAAAKPAADRVSPAVDNYFEKAKGRGRDYFEKAVNEHLTEFKSDLETTILRVNVQMREYLKDRLDEQLHEYSLVMKEAQDAALESLNRSLAELQEQHKTLAVTMQKNVAYQETVMNHAFKDSQIRLGALKTTQDAALDALNKEVAELQEERQQITAAVKQTVASQEAALVGVFEENMAAIIEHYLLGALGDQYDMKAQLPAIIKQLDENKAEIVEDMKL